MKLQKFLVGVVAVVVLTACTTTNSANQGTASPALKEKAVTEEKQNLNPAATEVIRSSTPSPAEKLLIAIKAAVDDRSLGTEAFVEKLRVLYPEQNELKENKRNTYQSWIFNENDFFIKRLYVNYLDNKQFLINIDFSHQSQKSSYCINNALMSKYFGDFHWSSYSAYAHPVQSDDEVESVRGAYHFYFWVAKDSYLDTSLIFERRLCVRSMSMRAQKFETQWPNNYPDKLDKALPPYLYQQWKEAQQ